MISTAELMNQKIVIRRSTEIGAQILHTIVLGVSD